MHIDGGLISPPRVAAQAQSVGRREDEMHVDGCQHTFEELAHTVLPAHMERLRTAILAARPVSEFGQLDAGPAAVARRLGLPGDFSGCYVMLEGKRPVYVGISRKVLSRLRQHLRGKTHFDASLAYAIAQRRVPTPGGRANAMEAPAFYAAFTKAQRYIGGLRVAFIPIKNPLELYVFEAYAAMSLRTHKWNTFRTH